MQKRMLFESVSMNALDCADHHHGTGQCCKSSVVCAAISMWQGRIVLEEKGSRRHALRAQTVGVESLVVVAVEEAEVEEVLETLAGLEVTRSVELVCQARKVPGPLNCNHVGCAPWVQVMYVCTSCSDMI